MFIPELIILPIDYDTNVNFIINYLSKDKQKNTTRPFYDKTITLYPELKDIADISDDNLKNERIRQTVIKKLTDNEYEIKKRIDYFKEKFNTFIYDFIEAQCKLYNYEWKESQPYIYCYVGYIPFYPRSAEEKCFYVSYQDEERVFSGAVHEINHMIFFEKWNEMHGGNCKEKQWPDPLWYLEEIIVDPTLNDERVKKHTLYENKAYPQFYEPNAKDGECIMDKIKKCYVQNEIIEDFLEQAYDIVKKYY